MPDIGPPHPVDYHIAAALRELRLSVGISQQTLSRCLGVSYQQLQKYEAGSNRIAASRLWDCAQVLGAPVGAFFPDPESEGASVETPEAKALNAWVSLYSQMPKKKRAVLFKLAEALREI